MPKSMTETNDVKSTAVPSVKPFPPGLARPDQTRDWATSLLSAVAAMGLTHISNARLPPGRFDDLYDIESLEDPPYVVFDIGALRAMRAVSAATCSPSVQAAGTRLTD